MYDITDRVSFNNIKHWMNEIGIFFYFYFIIYSIFFFITFY